MDEVGDHLPLLPHPQFTLLFTLYLLDPFVLLDDIVLQADLDPVIRHVRVHFRLPHISILDLVGLIFIRQTTSMFSRSVLRCEGGDCDFWSMFEAVLLVVCLHLIDCCSLLVVAVVFVSIVFAFLYSVALFDGCISVVRVVLILLLCWIEG